MKKAFKSKVFLLSCFVLLVLTGLFSNNLIFGHVYSVPDNGDLLVVVSYPLWQTSGGASGALHQQLQVYIQDLISESWNVKVLMVSTNYFSVQSNLFSGATTYSLYYNDPNIPDRLELKSAIMGHLPNNCSDTVSNGLVLIGSEPDIPTVWWRSSLKIDSQGQMEGCHPTDLYYADRADWEIWKYTNQPLYPDQAGYGDVYTFLDANGQLINPYYEPIPKLICGRISARAICAATTDPDRLIEEAGKITNYLGKIHNYRLNGSNLTSEQREAAVFYHEDSFTDVNLSGANNYPSLVEISNRLYEYKDLTHTNHETLTKALERGSQFFFIMDHTYQDAFCNEEWDANYRLTGYNLGLDELNAINPKVHFYYLFCCSACRYSVPNLGETLLCNNDYAYNVIGKTAPDNVAMGSDVVRELNDGETVGRAFYNDAYWLHDNFHYNGSCLSLSSHILLGDPALTYPRHIVNRPPVITNALVSTEFKANTQESITFQSYDPDSDPVTFTLEQVNQPSLPTGASFNGTTFSWTPSVTQAGKNYYFRVTATDSSQNIHQQEFTIYVNHFGEALFEDDTTARSSWNIPGDWTLSYIGDHPFKAFRDLNKRTNYMVQLTNKYGSIWQRIQVKPSTRYILGMYVGNLLTTNPDEVSLVIPQLNINYPINRGMNPDHPCEYFEVPVYTFDKSEIDVQIHFGNSSLPVSGQFALSNVKLYDTLRSDLVYLSDLTYEYGTTGWGNINMDKNAEGGALSLGGETFKKGIGAHANSTITYRLDRKYTRFLAYIGVDDQQVSAGSIVFEVKADGTSIYNSGIMYPNSPNKFVNIDVSNTTVLELIATDGGDGNTCDWADWADAKLVCPIYLSDLEWESATAGYTGLIQKDKSFGDTLVGFDNPITLNGVVYPKGIGTHAASTIIYNLDGKYQWFVSDIGIDDELDLIDPPNSYGRVKFQVYLDGTLAYDSGEMDNLTPTKHICLNLTLIDELKLVVDSCGSEANDHADWANAAIIKDVQTGLNAEYYQDKELFSCVGKEIDEKIDFTWGSTSPGFGLGADNYSVRWTGKIKPDFSATYTFTTAADDGVRLWVNGQKIIDYWYSNGWNLQSGTIALEAGKLYDIKVEYFENSGTSLVQLMWECSGLPIEIVPSANLYTR